MKTRRLGKIIISDAFWRDGYQDLAYVTKGCAILRAEHRLDLGAIEYIAYHPDFDEITIGEIVPEYVAQFTAQESGNPTIKWIRQ